MRFTSTLVAGAFAGLAYAQTHTECNPMEKTCPKNPAMAKEFNTDFKAGAASIKGWKQTAGSLKYTSSGADFTINKKGDAPTIQSETYLQFGYVEVKCKASGGQGVISSIVLQSEDLDEVDWEFIGTTNTNVQMNYFGKGNTTTYDRMIEGPVFNPQQEFHSYALNWTAESLTWIIDGAPIRTLKYADANGGKTYPQTPMTVRIGIWAGGDPDNEKGVIEWAGGKTDYSKSPYTMTIDSVKVINYSPGTEYEWTDKTGSYQSIKVIGAGNNEGSPANSIVLSSATAAATGGGLGSQVNVPTASATAGAGGEFHEGGGQGTKTPCSEGETMPLTTDVPEPSSTALPTAVFTNGSYVPVASETPCSCGVATVTVICTPPASSTALPVPTTLVAISSSATLIVPVPTPTGGLMTDTNPAPSVPEPTIPAPTIPISINGTTTAPTPTVSLFTGAAAQPTKHAAAFFVAAGMAMLIV